MAAELRQAIGRLPPAPAAVLAGRYLSTDRSRCDVENRLFTNVGASSFPRGLAAIRFERGTCRPVWLAMKTAAAGQIEVLAGAPPAGAEFGVRVLIHATSRGPRQPAVVSQTVVDGIIAAFHVGLGHGPAAAAAAAAMAPRLPGMAETDIEALAAGSTPGPLFSPSAFTVKGTHAQISPCDERCQAGEVTIRPDAEGQYPQISGEIFLLRPVSA